MPSAPSITWTLGPNRRIMFDVGPLPGWLPTLQLIDLEPGEFWLPALEAELLTPIILQPLPFPWAWRSFSANFSFNLRWQIFNTRIIVRWLGNFSTVYVFSPQFAVQTRMFNENSDFADNYAIGGGLNFQWGPI